ncbi:MULTISPECIES: DUF3710 domain-containing protein [unclassified Corynebacterium]|uniref:DUF3710 domain-containing protein n=1 Tax=unclassified Corynebacterium TaxID=2624378 RepID=UPI0029CA404A|nr:MULTISPECIES: DUF3710 domain-containing protein [unclassified Corynebacterium]WPF65223.1 DUF3710 domain-containing protein [Corynebacterium sp. 22KM0430]WPF67718.1 DUF3710 domain-containing protein [Corynebacterium sp. 21KM1197]
MALWPFGKKDKDTPKEEEQAGNSVAASSNNPEVQHVPASTEATPNDDSAEQEGLSTSWHDAINGDTGPFDGDSVNIEDFDFSDFAGGILNLGSLKLPLPSESQVQVEMGEQGPRMLHVVTRYGRITPVAFAAPRTGSQWRQAVTEIVDQMRGDGLEPEVEDGPWGREVVTRGSAGVIRLIGVDGPRWMLRFTLAGPLEAADDLATLGRELAARTFVYRGEQPILAGNSLPVALPKQLVDQVNQAMKQRAEQENQ